MAEIQMKIVYAYCFLMSEVVVIPLAFYYICTFFFMLSSSRGRLSSEMQTECPNLSFTAILS